MWENTFVLLFDYLVSTRVGNIIAVFFGALIFYFIFRLIVRIIDYIMFKRLVDGVLDAIYYDYYDDQAQYDKDDKRYHKKHKENDKVREFNGENNEKDLKYSRVDGRYDEVKYEDTDDKKSSYTKNVEYDYTDDKFEHEENEKNNTEYEKTNDTKKRKIVGLAKPVGKWTFDTMMHWMRKNRDLDINLMNNSGYFQALVDKQKKAKNGTGIGSR